MATSLHEQRLGAVIEHLLESRATSVLDLGCGPGELLQRLVMYPQFNRIVGIDIDTAKLNEARLLLGLSLFGSSERVSIRCGSFEQKDAELKGFSAATLIETIEHIDPGRLSRVEHAVFGFMQPRLILVTTPNQEYNPLHGFSSGERRHPDHRFEWDRGKFRQWSQGVATRNGYAVEFFDIGPLDPLHGSSTQMARFNLVSNDP
jgi:3' terminal RNA ribose 2'-O-methyltransferase Hen1